MSVTWRARQGAGRASLTTPYPSPPRPSASVGPALVLACITTATFTDLVAYSVAVPVLPDFATRFNAGPTTIGLLFASFGVTLLILSIPMGAISDRVGRKGPDDRRTGAARGRDAGVCVRAIAADAVRGAAAAGRGRRDDVDRGLRDDRGPLRPRRARPRDGTGHGRQHARHHHRPRARRMALRDRRHPPAVPVRRRDGGRSISSCLRSWRRGRCGSGRRGADAARADASARRHHRARRRSPAAARLPCSSRSFLL